jgi:hypothetical protein
VRVEAAAKACAEAPPWQSLDASAAERANTSQRRQQPKPDEPRYDGPWNDWLLQSDNAHTDQHNGGQGDSPPSSPELQRNIRARIVNGGANLLYINPKPLIMNSAKASETPKTETAFSNLDSIIDGLPTIPATNQGSKPGSQRLIAVRRRTRDRKPVLSEKQTGCGATDTFSPPLATKSRKRATGRHQRSIEPRPMWQRRQR